MPDQDFIDHVIDTLDSGFPIDDVEELFSVSRAAMEVVAITETDLFLFFSELFSYEEDDLPVGFEKYLTELDFFSPESWEVIRCTTDEDILAECTLLVMLDSSVQDQLVLDLPQFFD